MKTKKLHRASFVGEAFYLATALLPVGEIVHVVAILGCLIIVTACAIWSD